MRRADTKHKATEAAILIATTVGKALWAVLMFHSRTSRNCSYQTSRVVQDNTFDLGGQVLYAITDSTISPLPTTLTSTLILHVPLSRASA